MLALILANPMCRQLSWPNDEESLMTAVPPWPTGQAEPYALCIGDIGVTRSWVVTPRGSAPLAGSEWFTANHTGYTQQIPVWAIICAVLLFPLGLLFLLCKETKVTGWVEVTVRSGQLVHTVAVPAGDGTLAWVLSNVGRAQELARQAAWS
jgi:hypothetical protein